MSSERKNVVANTCAFADRGLPRSNYDACLKNARRCLATSDGIGALDALRTWSANQPLDSQYYDLLAQVLRSLLRNDEALAAIATGESTQPSAALLVMKGKLYRYRGDYELGRIAYLKAIAIDADHADAHCQIGILDQYTGQHDLALRAFQLAVALDPARGMHWLCLGDAYIRREAWLVAETCFACAAEAFRTDSSENRLYNLACLASIRGDIDRAYKLFEHFLAHHSYALAWAEKDENLNALRADPRFWTLFHEHGAPYESREGER